MTENNPTLASLAETLAEVSKQLEAIRGGESTPDIDPNDPLNEVLPDIVTDRNASFSLDRSADDYLKKNFMPRTIRNLLLAYAHCHPLGYSFSLDSQEGDGVYRIHRVVSCLAESPAGDTRSPLRSTSTFPLPLDKPAAELIGWTFRFLNRQFKVLDACEIDGRSYLITES